MHPDTARAEAERCTDLMRAYLRQLEREIAPDDE